MSVCTDLYYPVLLRPRRIRAAECASFQEQNRWVNFWVAFNLTPVAEDNAAGSGIGAWTVGDLPVSVAMQDVSARGDDLLLVAIADRVYVLDWERYRDEWNWEVFLPIYRRLTIGPIPGSKDEEEDGKYALANLKRFRRFTFELGEEPTHTPTQSQYVGSVNEAGALASTASVGTRITQRHGNLQIARRGYSFLVTLEHDANEDFPLLWWQADFEELGDRRANDAIVRNP